MKKMLSILVMVCGLSLAGCSTEDYTRYSHEYTGVIEMRVRNSGVVIGRVYSGSGKVIYQVDCGEVIIDEFDGDEAFRTFLIENAGEKVKVYVDVIAREDHEASYGTYEVTGYEIIK